MTDISLLEKNLGYTFNNIGLLEKALIHPSFLNEKNVERIYSNQRLEFFGDSVLSLAVSEYIFTNLKTFPEGKLTELLTLAVSIVVIVLINLFKKKFGDVATALISSNKSVKDKIADDEQSRSEASKHFLNLIDALKEMIFKRIDELDKALDEVKERLDNGVTAEQARRLETITFDAIKMLDTVYMGSSTIPSTVKERVAESYNHAERAMRNDEIIGEEP